jgi:hypothetical protein
MAGAQQICWARRVPGTPWHDAGCQLPFPQLLERRPVSCSPTRVMNSEGTSRLVESSREMFTISAVVLAYHNMPITGLQVRLNDDGLRWHPGSSPEGNGTLTSPQRVRQPGSPIGSSPPTAASSASATKSSNHMTAAAASIQWLLDSAACRPQYI